MIFFVDFGVGSQSREPKVQPNKRNNSARYPCGCPPACLHNGRIPQWGPALGGFSGVGVHGGGGSLKSVLVGVSPVGIFFEFSVGV